MKKKGIRFLALLVTAALLLAGCDLNSVLSLFDGNADIVSYRDMEYVRPDMAELQAVLDEGCALAQSATSVDAVMEGVYAFYDVYDRFSTSYALADIRYNSNLTDTYWETEYNFCLENSPAADAALEELYCALAKSPLRSQLEGEDYFGERFFDAYGDTTYDETMMSLLEQEAQLVAQYYTLSEQAADTEYYSEEYFTTYGTQMATLFVELVKQRQKLAAYAGYDSYPEYAYACSYYRDYSPAQAEEYLKQLGNALYQPYCNTDTDSIFEAGNEYCSELQTFHYVKTVANAMGGTPEEAFALLDAAELYDIEYSPNKFDSSFEIYLWSYYEPFIFMCPYLDQSDKLTFSHEFGHFCNDYICGGSYAGTDVAEVHSQAFEYLSLCYGQNTEALTQYKLADSMCIYMENAAYSLFELQVYTLTDQALTPENVTALYKSIGTDFGFTSWDWDYRDWVTVPHFFTEPMYMISYVVSNDLAMQIYELELETPGAGLALYEECLTSQESYILTFAETYGLESPFAEGRLEEVAKLFQGN